MATDSINLDCVELKRGNYIKLTITSNLESVKILENEKAEMANQESACQPGACGREVFFDSGGGVGVGRGDKGGRTKWGGWRVGRLARRGEG